MEVIGGHLEEALASITNERGGKLARRVEDVDRHHVAILRIALCLIAVPIALEVLRNFVVVHLLPACTSSTLVDLVASGIRDQPVTTHGVDLRNPGADSNTYWHITLLAGFATELLNRHSALCATTTAAGPSKHPCSCVFSILQ